MSARRKIAMRGWTLAIAALGLASGVWAQAPGQPESDLGSPAAAVAARGAGSTDYRALVEAALPRVSAESLAARLKEVEKEGRERLRVADARAWAGLFGLAVDRLAGDAARAVESGEIVTLERGAVRARPREGRFWVALQQETKPLPRQEFARLLPEIRRVHAALAERIGIPRRQVFHTDFRETLAQATPRPELREREGPIESVGATTTLVRAVGGILVDGSFARLVSADAQRLEMVDVRWPEVVLACEIGTEKIRSPRELADRLVERVAAAAAKRPVSVLMAVVLRPLRTPYRPTYVPALRVGVVPKSERVGDGYRTDAGEVLYVDLVAGFEEEDRREAAPESAERKEAGAAQ